VRFSNLDEKRLFPDTSSTNTDTLGPSKHTEYKSYDLSHPLSHQVGHHLQLSNVPEKIYQLTCELLYATNTSNGKYLFISLALSPFAQKNYNGTLLFGNGRHFDY
jgi:hypothetical protein